VLVKGTEEEVERRDIVFIRLRWATARQVGEKGWLKQDLAFIGAWAGRKADERQKTKKAGMTPGRRRAIGSSVVLVVCGVIFASGFKWKCRMALTVEVSAYVQPLGISLPKMR